MRIKILFATLLTLALFTAGYAQTPDKAKLDQFFDRLAEKNKAMGSLTIARDGKVLYTRAIGYSQISGTEKKPLTAANRFRIGSITKMFTAALSCAKDALSSSTARSRPRFAESLKF